jgi:phospholipid/cholesterol/gamma-HCH transport system substrate-binding protein
MDRDRRLSLTVGGLALVSLVVLAVAILSLSSQQGIWTPHYRLVGYFDNVGGLIDGAPVWLAGKRVGGVENVAFDAGTSGRQAVKVVMQVERSAQERIRGDSVATIGTIGLLGDVYVELSLGTAEAAILEDGGEVATLDPMDLNRMIARGAQALDQITNLTSTLNDVVSEFEQAEGARNLADALSGLGDVIAEVKEGGGTLHSLIYDDYGGSGLESVERSLTTVENILQEIAQGDGVLHSMIYDAPTEQDVVLQVLQAGARLNSILGKIDRGEGSFGLMLNDPTLYEELTLLVGGANRSRVVRALINLTTPDDR